MNLNSSPLTFLGLQSQLSLNQIILNLTNCLCSFQKYWQLRLEIAEFQNNHSFCWMNILGIEINLTGQGYGLSLASG